MLTRRAYLDYQASTPLDPRVRAVLLDMLNEPGNSSAQEHAFGWSAAARIEAARAQVGSALGADADEIVFTSGATEANNLAILGAARAAPPGRARILIGALEHKSVTEAAEQARRSGFHVEVIPAAADGIVHPAALAARIGTDVAVVSVMAVNNEIGTIQPIEELGRVARQVGAFFHVDGTQALAAQEVNVVQWGVDSLSISGHKIYAPQGVGALYLALDAPWRPLPMLFGGGQEWGLRPGTTPAAMCAALGEACRLIGIDGTSERAKVRSLRDQLAETLRAVAPGMVITCEGSQRHPGCLHVRFPGRPASDLLTRMQPSVAASTGSACTSGIIGPSPVLIALGMDPMAADECIRYSVGRFSTREDVEIAAAALQAAIQRAAA